MNDARLTYTSILSKAWPIIIASASVPALGLVDTAVIGHFGSTTALAALALCGLIFSFIYWGVGFLRMATTAYVAQAVGAGNQYRLMTVVTQSGLIALVLALGLLLMQPVLLTLCLSLLQPPEAVSPLVSEYFFIRIWAAPATLMMYVVSGYLIGRGFSKTLLLLQLLLNGANAGLDILFAGVFGWGITGIAWGTVIAEYLTIVVGLVVIARLHPWPPFLASLTRTELFSDIGILIRQNGDIFIRTLFLLLGFAFFANIGGGFGEHYLAANHILLQLISFSAFFMDGFAHVLESLAGRAIGKRSVSQLKEACVKSSVLAAATACVLALTVFLIGSEMTAALTNKPDIQLLTNQYTPFAALYILLSVAAFQLDGLYIGVAYGSAMRNCSIVSTLVLVLVWYAGLSQWGNVGLWWSFIIYVCVRALTLLAFLPRLVLKFNTVNVP